MFKRVHIEWLKIKVVWPVIFAGRDFCSPTLPFMGLPSAPGICCTDDPLASILLLLMTKAIHFWDLILLFGSFDLQTVDPDTKVLA